MSSAAAWWIEKIGPGAIAGAVSLVGIWWVQRKTAKQFAESNALAREGQRIQRDQFAESHTLAREGQQIQKNQFQKVLRVEKHAEAYHQWYLLFYLASDPSNETLEQRVDTLEGVQTWYIANQFYLDKTVANALAEAIRARQLLDGIGLAPETLHLRKETFDAMVNAGTQIKVNAPRLSD